MASEITARFLSRATCLVGGKGRVLWKKVVWTEWSQNMLCWCLSSLSLPPPPAHPTTHGAWLSLVSNCLSHSVDWGPLRKSEILAPGWGGCHWDQNHVHKNTRPSLSFLGSFFQWGGVSWSQKLMWKTSCLTLRYYRFLQKQKIFLFVSVS